MAISVGTYTVGTVLFSTFLFLAYWYQNWTRRARMLKKFPGPSQVPVLGAALHFLGVPFQGYVKVFTKMVEQVNRHPFRMWALHRPFIVAADPDTFQKFLTSVDQVEKSVDYDNFQWILGDGLVNSKARIWKKDRKTLTPLFKYQRFDRFVDIFNHYGRILAEASHDVFKKQDKDYDITNMICKFTCDCILEAFSGVRETIQKDPDGDNHPILVMSNTLKVTFIQGVLTPWLTWPIVRDIFGLGLQQKKCIRDRAALLAPMIANMRAQYEKNLINQTIAEDEEPLTFPMLRAGMTEQEMVNQFTTIAGAGFKTSVVGIVMTFFCLAANPKHQEIVHEELDRVFGDDRTRDVTFDDLNELKYLDMCVKEALRIFPPIAQILRHTTRDVKLDNGLTIPPGCDIFLLIYQLHRDPVAWPDPEKFDPERFLPENCAKRSAYSWVPFSAGPRNCIGTKYANPQMRIALAHVLRNFTITTNNKQENVKTGYGVSLTLEGHEMTFVPKPL